MSPSQSDSPIDLIRERSDVQTPPRDPRNVWRVLAANGWSREVASEGNAQDKAAGYDRGCPPRECPHRVQRWTGSEWVDVERTIAAGKDERSRLFVRDIEPDPGYEVQVFDQGEEVAVEPGTWEEFVPISDRDGFVDVLADLGFTFEGVADGWKINMAGSFSVWDTTPLKAWNRWKKVNDGR